jgi:hypothetical protein
MAQPNERQTRAPADASEICKLIDTWVKAFETAELAERLERLERMTSQ